MSSPTGHRYSRRTDRAGLPRLDRAARAVVLSPHLDDAALSCWTALDGPAPLHVVNVCSGSPASGVLGSWDRITGAHSSCLRVLERTSEDAAALRELGHVPLGLGFLDAQYRDGAPLDAASVLSALAGAVPALSGVYAPLGIGGHPDHLAVRDVALELARRGIPVSLYADMPYAIEYGWPGWVAGAAGHPASVEPAFLWQDWLDAIADAAPRLRPMARPLSSDMADRKLSTMRGYRTQFAALDGPRGKLSNPDARRFEVFWSIRPRLRRLRERSATLRLRERVAGARVSV